MSTSDIRDMDEVADATAISGIPNGSKDREMVSIVQCALEKQRDQVALFPVGLAAQSGCIRASRSDESELHLA